MGSAAFASAASVAGLLVASHADVMLVWWIVPGAIVAALAELLPLKVDDNVTVPIAAAIAMAVLRMA